MTEDEMIEEKLAGSLAYVRGTPTHKNKSARSAGSTGSRCGTHLLILRGALTGCDDPHPTRVKHKGLHFRLFSLGRDLFAVP